MKPPSIRTSFSTAPRKLDPRLAVTPAAVDKIAEKLGHQVLDEDAGPHGDPGPAPPNPPSPSQPQKAASTAARNSRPASRRHRRTPAPTKSP